MDKRDTKIDLIKGMAVIFVVLAHCGFPYSKFLYLFHTSLFFCCSGFLWNDKYSEDIHGIMKLIKRKLFSLWLPYVIWNGTFMLLNNVLCWLNMYLFDFEQWNEVYTTVGAYDIHKIYTAKEMLIEFFKICIFMGGTELGGASWFLRTLFFVTILFAIIRMIAKSISKNNYIVVEIVVGVILSFIGRFIRSYSNICTYDGKIVQLFDIVGNALMVYVLLVIGNITKIYFERIKWCTVSIIGLIGTIILHFVPLSSVKMTFGIVNSTLGWLMVWGCVLFILSRINILKNIMAMFGRNSMWIFMGHFACFKLVNIIVQIIENKPIYYRGAFPVMYGDKYWLLYAILGIGLPLLLCQITQLLKKNNCLKRLKK